jgi:hypothetical protein
VTSYSRVLRSVGLAVNTMDDNGHHSVPDLETAASLRRLSMASGISGASPFFSGMGSTSTGFPQGSAQRDSLGRSFGGSQPHRMSVAPSPKDTQDAAAALAQLPTSPAPGAMMDLPGLGRTRGDSITLPPSAAVLQAPHSSSAVINSRAAGGRRASSWTIGSNVAPSPFGSVSMAGRVGVHGHSPPPELLGGGSPAASGSSGGGVRTAHISSHERGFGGGTTFGDPFGTGSGRQTRPIHGVLGGATSRAGLGSGARSSSAHSGLLMLLGAAEAHDDDHHYDDEGGPSVASKSLPHGNDGVPSSGSRRSRRAGAGHNSRFQNAPGGYQFVDDVDEEEEDRHRSGGGTQDLSRGGRPKRARSNPPQTHHPSAVAAAAKRPQKATGSGNLLAGMSAGTNRTTRIRLRVTLDDFDEHGHIRHRASCHRCGNMRKKNVQCEACPHIFCQRCTEKMLMEHGETAFDNGCPVCKGLCCCAGTLTGTMSLAAVDDSGNCACPRIYHCYKKCPMTKTGAIEPDEETIASLPLSLDEAAPIVRSLLAWDRQKARGVPEGGWPRGQGPLADEVNDQLNGVNPAETAGKQLTQDRAAAAAAMAMAAKPRGKVAKPVSPKIFSKPGYSAPPTEAGTAENAAALSQMQANWARLHAAAAYAALQQKLQQQAEAAEEGDSAKRPRLEGAADASQQQLNSSQAAALHAALSALAPNIQAALIQAANNGQLRLTPALASLAALFTSPEGSATAQALQSALNSGDQVASSAAMAILAQNHAALAAAAAASGGTPSQAPLPTTGIDVAASPPATVGIPSSVAMRILMSSATPATTASTTFMAAASSSSSSSSSYPQENSEGMVLTLPTSAPHRDAVMDPSLVSRASSIGASPSVTDVESMGLPAGSPPLMGLHHHQYGSEAVGDTPGGDDQPFSSVHFSLGSRGRSDRSGSISSNPGSVLGFSAPGESAPPTSLARSRSSDRSLRSASGYFGPGASFASDLGSFSLDGLSTAPLPLDTSMSTPAFGPVKGGTDHRK